MLSETILTKDSSRVCLLHLGPFIVAPYKKIYVWIRFLGKEAAN